MGQQIPDPLPIMGDCHQFQLAEVVVGDEIVDLHLEVFEGEFVARDDEGAHDAEEDGMDLAVGVVEPVTAEHFSLVVGNIP